MFCLSSCTLVIINLAAMIHDLQQVNVKREKVKAAELVPGSRRKSRHSNMYSVKHKPNLNPHQLMMSPLFFRIKNVIVKKEVLNYYIKINSGQCLASESQTTFLSQRLY